MTEYDDRAARFCWQPPLSFRYDILAPPVKPYRVSVRGIACLEIVGGIVGCLSIGWLYMVREGSAFDRNVQLTLLPFGLITTSGVALLRSQRVGLWLSLVMQTGQAVAWHLATTTWRFCAGPFISITFFPDTTSIFAGWHSSLAWGQVSDGAPAFVSLNLVSVVLGYTLWRQLIAKPASR